MTYDNTREQDLKELYEARQNANAEERDRLDEIKYKIMRDSEDDEVVDRRRELVQAVRNNDKTHVRKVSEELKIIGYKKGTDRNG